MATTTRVRRPKKHPTTIAPATLDGPVVRFTVAQYLQMVESGILPEEPRCELLEGWIVPQMPHNPPHGNIVFRLQMLLVALIGNDWLARGQSCLETTNSVPKPDIAVLVGPVERYDDVHPTTDDIGLVIEVSDSTLARDQTTKLAIYARDHIPEYWIVNLVNRRVEVYTLPRAGRTPTYRQRTDYVAGQEIPVVLHGNKLGIVAVNDIIPLPKS